MSDIEQFGHALASVETQPWSTTVTLAHWLLTNANRFPITQILGHLDKFWSKIEQGLAVQSHDVAIQDDFAQTTALAVQTLAESVIPRDTNPGEVSEMLNVVARVARKFLDEGIVYNHKLQLVQFISSQLQAALDIVTPTIPDESLSWDFTWLLLNPSVSNLTLTPELVPKLNSSAWIEAPTAVTESAVVLIAAQEREETVAACIMILGRMFHDLERNSIEVPSIALTTMHPATVHSFLTVVANFGLNSDVSAVEAAEVLASAWNTLPVLGTAMPEFVPTPSAAVVARVSSLTDLIWWNNLPVQQGVFACMPALSWNTVCTTVETASPFSVVFAESAGLPTSPSVGSLSVPASKLWLEKYFGKQCTQVALGRTPCASGVLGERSQFSNGTLVATTSPLGITWAHLEPTYRQEPMWFFASLYCIVETLYLLDVGGRFHGHVSKDMVVLNWASPMAVLLPPSQLPIDRLPRQSDRYGLALLLQSCIKRLPHVSMPVGIGMVALATTDPQASMSDVRNLYRAVYDRIQIRLRSMTQTIPSGVSGDADGHSRLHGSTQTIRPGILEDIGEYNAEAMKEVCAGTAFLMALSKTTFVAAKEKALAGPGSLQKVNVRDQLQDLARAGMFSGVGVVEHIGLLGQRISNSKSRHFAVAVAVLHTCARGLEKLQSMGRIAWDPRCPFMRKLDAAITIATWLLSSHPPLDDVVTTMLTFADDMIVGDAEDVMGRWDPLQAQAIGAELQETQRQWDGTIMEFEHIHETPVRVEDWMAQQIQGDEADTPQTWQDVLRGAYLASLGYPKDTDLSRVGHNAAEKFQELVDAVPSIEALLSSVQLQKELEKAKIVVPAMPVFEMTVLKSVAFIPEEGIPASLKRHAKDVFTWPVADGSAPFAPPWTRSAWYLYLSDLHTLQTEADAAGSDVPWYQHPWYAQLFVDQSKVVVLQGWVPEDDFKLPSPESIPLMDPDKQAKIKEDAGLKRLMNLFKIVPSLDAQSMGTAGAMRVKATALWYQVKKNTLLADPEEGNAVGVSKACCVVAPDAVLALLQKVYDSPETTEEALLRKEAKGGRLGALAHANVDGTARDDPNFPIDDVLEIDVLLPSIARAKDCVDLFGMEADAWQKVKDTLLHPKVMVTAPPDNLLSKEDMPKMALLGYQDELPGYIACRLAEQKGWFLPDKDLVGATPKSSMQREFRYLVGRDKRGKLQYIQRKPNTPMLEEFDQLILLETKLVIDSLPALDDLKIRNMKLRTRRLFILETLSRMPFVNTNLMDAYKKPKSVMNFVSMHGNSADFAKLPAKDAVPSKFSMYNRMVGWIASRPETKAVYPITTSMSPFEKLALLMCFGETFFNTYVNNYNTILKTIDTNIQNAKKTTLQTMRSGSAEPEVHPDDKTLRRYSGFVEQEALLLATYEARGRAHIALQRSELEAEKAVATVVHQEAVAVLEEAERSLQTLVASGRTVDPKTLDMFTEGVRSLKTPVHKAEKALETITSKQAALTKFESSLEKLPANQKSVLLYFKKGYEAAWKSAYKTLLTMKMITQSYHDACIAKIQPAVPKMVEVDEPEPELTDEEKVTVEKFIKMGFPRHVALAKIKGTASGLGKSIRRE